MQLPEGLECMVSVPNCIEMAAGRLSLNALGSLWLCTAGLCDSLVQSEAPMPVATLNLPYPPWGRQGCLLGAFLTGLTRGVKSGVHYIAFWQGPPLPNDFVHCTLQRNHPSPLWAPWMHLECPSEALEQPCAGLWGVKGQERVENSPQDCGI